MKTFKNFRREKCEAYIKNIMESWKIKSNITDNKDIKELVKTYWLPRKQNA